MAGGYRHVKHCRLCKKRYLIEQGQKMQEYCDDCIARFRKEQNKEEKEK